MVFAGAVCKQRLSVHFCQKHENNAADLQISFLALLLKRLHSSHQAAVPCMYVFVVTQHDVIDLRLMGGA